MNETLAQGQKSITEGITMAQEIGELAAMYLVKYGFQLLGALIIFAIGWKIAGWFAGLFIKFGAKKHFDVTLTNFIAMVIKVTILVFVSLMTLEKLGVTINPLIAAASAAIFGASFAIQAPLSNYAAGLMVILTRPFSVGNTIQVKGVYGLVHEIKLPNTILLSADGEKITIPNKEIVGEILYNSGHNRVAQKSVGISYGADPQKAIEIIRGAILAQPAVQRTPEPQVGIDSFGDSAINISMRYWIETPKYAETVFAANLAVFRALKTAGIDIPFPQREVRMLEK
jgi:small conductance mechanosensitive channel